jgi:hypothetical protein
MRQSPNMQKQKGDKEMELIGKRQALKASSEIIFSENNRIRVKCRSKKLLFEKIIF